jgi:hypothetical protein
MANKLRRLPPVCLLFSLTWMLSRKLRYNKKYIGNKLKMDNGEEYIIFRHITCSIVNPEPAKCVFIVSFKFKRLSHKANKIVSLIPMLLITGFPGFSTKIYAENPLNGYWQGMYQWKSKKHLEEYKKSFVFRMMNKRAIPGSIKSIEFADRSLFDIIKLKKL